MKTIKTAWVWIAGESNQYKEMSFESIKALCKERNLQICKNRVFFDVDEFTFSPKSESIMEYGFSIGHYLLPPHIELVPAGTKIENGYYVFPKK